MPNSRKGGTFVGNLKRGNAWEKEEGTHPQSSIPSSYVTILLPYREKDGFNSRTTRFSKRSNELRGPGYYHNPTSFVNTTGSMSCKGYCSGFLSKDRRFGSKLGNASRYVPGPGEYAQRAGLHIKDDKYFNRSTTTAAFSKSVENLVPHKKKDTKTKFTPGPGAYEYDNSFSLAQNSSAALATKSSISAFKSSTKRFGAKSNDGASVGQYTLPDGFKVKEQKYTTFKSSTGRYHATDAKAPKDRLPNKDPQKAVVVSQNELVNLPGPGPGTYEVGMEDIDTSVRMKFGKYSSIFGKTTCTDRFGKPVQPKVDRSISPGPGQYSHSGRAVKSHGANSVFISSTDRSASSGIYQLGVAPGPCLYNPGRVDKKTFHLNTKKRWM